MNCQNGLLPDKPKPETIQKRWNIYSRIMADARKRWPGGIELAVNSQNQSTTVIPKEEILEQGRALTYSKSRLGNYYYELYKKMLFYRRILMPPVILLSINGHLILSGMDYLYSFVGEKENYS